MIWGFDALVLVPEVRPAERVAVDNEEDAPSDA